MRSHPGPDGSAATPGHGTGPASQPDVHAAPEVADEIARSDADLGLIALHSPADPEPSLQIVAGTVVELDGRRREDFDVIDAFIAQRGLDLRAGPHAMATPDTEIARMLVDPGVPRAEVVALAAGLTPAKLAAVVRQLQPAELMLAMTKLRARRTPSAHAQVSNRLDDPLLLAADTAVAVALGFRELATTSPTSADAASNAVAVLIGAQVGGAGALTDCDVDEAAQLRLGLRGLLTSAQSISVAGTEKVLLDGDDTPWSKAFLLAGYASRGIKSRVSSGAGGAAIAGGAEGHSMLYLEARCVLLAKAIGAQGVRNAGAASAALAASVPDGVLELHYETLLSMMLGLESTAGGDVALSSSPGRRMASALPGMLAGADQVLSGFGAVARYDNMFGPSNLNLDDLPTYLLLQRDWGVDAGLRTLGGEQVRAIRQQAAEACRAVYSWLGIGDFTDEHLQAAIAAGGSRDLPQDIGLAVLAGAQTIDQQGITGLDIAVALEETGFSEEADRLLTLLRERVRGDHLQVAAVFDDDLRVLSAVTDPNDYAGPGTGHCPDHARRGQIADVRGQRSLIDLRGEQDGAVQPELAVSAGSAVRSEDPRDVVVAVSPAFARSVWQTLAGLPVAEVLDEILAGLEEEGCLGRVVRVASTADLGRVAWLGASLSGSGIAVAIGGTGTARVTRRGLSPLAHLEELGKARQLDATSYRKLGINAARHAKGSVPQPVRSPMQDDGGIDSPTRTVTYVALEQEQLAPGTTPELLEVTRD